MRTATAILFLSVAALMALGMTILYSSSMAQKGAHYLQMQALWGGAGMVACLVAAAMDYRWLRKINWWLFAGVLVLLILVLIPGIGVLRSGSRRWLNLGVAYFQPSELAKLALIVMLAVYGEKCQGQIRQFWKGLVVPVLCALPMLAVIFVEPDRGTTILLAAVTCGVLLLAGVRWAYVVLPAVLGAGFIIFSIMHDPVRMARIESWLHPELYKNETGYQAWQAMLGLGAGGMDGLGLGNGRQKISSSR
jgi:cell division protein FtsW